VRRAKSRSSIGVGARVARVALHHLLRGVRMHCRRRTTREVVQRRAETLGRGRSASHRRLIRR
jgi:hypothetical protein